MNAIGASTTDDPRVTRAVEEYLAALERGERPQRQQFLARHAAVAVPLGDCLDALDFLYTATGELRLDGAPAPDGSNATALAAAGVLGDYRIIGEIGRGGMGVVYEAEQVSLSRRVALKVLPFASVLDPRQLQRFKNEALAAAQLDHPNIVDVYAVGCERGVHYYAMRHIEGHTLADVIRELRWRSGLEVRDATHAALLTTRIEEGGSRIDDGRNQQISDLSPQTDAPLTTHDSPATTSPLAALSTEHATNPRAYFRRVAEIGIQIAEALDYAHQHGIVHRDIKPSNLMLDAAGKAWVTDFGLAHIEAEASLTMTGDVMGTLRYMSPQQAAGNQRLVDYRADVYSLGITLYELLTLRPAFAGADRANLLHQIAAEDPHPPRRFVRSIAADLETIVLKAIAKEPNERYATAQEFASDLRRFLADQPIRASRPGLSSRLRKWGRRHRTACTAAVAILILSLIAAGWLKIRHESQLDRTERLARESLTAAATAVEARNYALARERLAEASSRVLPGNRRFVGLSAELGQLRSQVDARVEATTRFEEFMRLNHENRYLLHVRQEAEVRTLAKRILSLYGVLEDANWVQRLERDHLTAEQSAKYRKTAYELLILLADHRIRWWNQPEAGYEGSQRDAARMSMHYLQKLVTFHPPTLGYYWVRSQCRKALGELQAAEEDARRAREMTANLGVDYFLIARHAHWARDEEEALRWYQAALRVEPDHYPSLYMMGLSFDQLGRKSEAILAFTACISHQPQHGLAYTNRARLLTDLGRTEEALADLTKVTNLAADATLSNSAQILGASGQAYYTLGRYEEAVAAFTGYIGLNPHDFAGYCVRSCAFIELGRLDEALADLNMFCQIAPRNRVAFSNRALVHSRLGRADDAIADLTKLIELVPDDASAYLRRATLHAQVQRYEQARTDYQRASQLDIREPKQMNNAAWFLATCPYVAFRAPAEAVRLARRAVELKPDDGTYWNTLGVAHYRAGNCSEAIAALHKAEEFLPDTFFAFNGFFLAMAHCRLDNRGEARQWYDKAVEWMAKNAPNDKELFRFRAEAEALLYANDPVEAPRPRAELTAPTTTHD
ncbi:MAG TPA: protein kinase [Planctomycetaceae bacterium]|nr:protein kinase [Planctomycetaceae bacterium]